MKKGNRPAWFKMFRNQKALIDSVPDAEVGQALKAVYQYFEDGTVVEMPPLVFAVFSSVKPYVDESFSDFETASKKNRANIKQRWAKRNDTSGTTGNQSLPVDTSGNDWIPSDTEAEADSPLTGGGDASIASRNIKAGEPPLCGGGPPPPFRYEPPIYYDERLGRCVDRRDSEK